MNYSVFPLQKYLPLVCLQVKLSVQLPHRDRLWIQHVSVNRLEGIPTGRRLPLQRRHRILQDLITLKQNTTVSRKPERAPPASL